MDISTLPSYREVIELLDSFANLERSQPAPGALTGGSERMAKLMKRLGSPHASIPAIHIAGTKGKGSVTGLVAAAVSAAGIKTGAYTSPHVENLRERIMINGRSIGEHRFVEACSAVLREAEAMRKDMQAPSYFEILTATALVAFAGANVEAMILETGLGGRLDATNLSDLRLVATGITAISKDHEDILGHSLPEIAREKVAIIRKAAPVVVMPQTEEVMRVILDRAKSEQSRVFTVGGDVKFEIRKPVTPDKPNLGQRVDFETWYNVYPDIPLAMLGEHQARNAAMALGLADLFLEYMDREPLDSIVLKRAWRSFILPGRMEMLGVKPWRIVDGAHNPAAAWAAAETIPMAFSTTKRTLIFGVAADKDWRTMLRILAPFFQTIVFTPFDSPRAAEPIDLAAFIEKEYPGIKTASAIDPAHALELAEGFTPEDGLILSTGSLYLAGEMRVLGRRERRPRT